MRGAGRLPLVALCVLCLAACTAVPAEDRPAPAATPVAPTPTPTPLDLPERDPDEITRSVVRDGEVAIRSAALPDVGALYIDVACSGPRGSTMGYALESGDDPGFGPSGEAACDGPLVTAGLGIADEVPREARVVLTPDDGVLSGYAILRRGPGS